MANVWSLFEDYEDRYHNWLKQSAVPKVEGWYDKSGIDPKFQNIQTGLLGTQQWDPSGTKRIGGVLGEGGSLATAGGQVQDYFQGEKVWTPDAPTNLNRTGVHSSTSMKHLNIGLEKAKDVFNWSVAKVESGFDAMFPQFADKNISTNQKKKMIAENIKTDPFGKDKRGAQPAFTEQDASSLAKFAGVNLKDVAAKFKDKGGFEGLMANPAFTLGLALMQSSAQGKTVGSGVLDNFVKAAGLSDHYKDRIEAREDRLKAKTEVIGTPTDEDRGMVERFLKSKKYGGPSNFQKIKGWFTGDDPQGDYERALSSISVEMKEYIAETYKGKRHRVTDADFEAAVNRLIDSGEIEKTPGLPGFLSNFRQFHGKIRKKKTEFRAEGGPVQAGQPYVVGEKGPEVVVPNANANVVSNDDSQVMSMLLASNPQLQNVSRPRAESILRSRFPDYFA